MTSPVSMPAGHAIVASDLDAYENATAAWVTWTPTLTNLTLGSGTVVARYRQVGQTIDYRFGFFLGAGSAVGTAPAFTLPATPHADYVVAGFTGFPVGLVYINDSGAGFWTGFALCLATNVATITYSTEVGNGTTTGITATVPFTWATNDRIIVYGTFEEA